jgi:myo-inositol 2-dehydrogenase / D-chiro-inositol 1-dehydrogenase
MTTSKVQHSTRRRDFVLGSMAVAAASESGLAADREIRIASIGTGNRGTSLLKQSLSQPNVRIAAVCDTNANARDKAQSLAARDNPKSFTDYRQVLDLKDVEAVHIATPCYLHAEMAAACLEAGKYVYCEKPLGITPEQVDKVVRTAKRAKTFLQIGQQLRYFPVVRETVRQINELKIIGQPFVIKAQRHSGPVKPESEASRPAWYKDVKFSGDLIVENAVHNIDVCNWLAGSRPVSAYGHGKKYFPKPIPAGTEMMDGFSVEYIYENGMHLDYSQLYMHPRGLKKLPNGQWYVIFGEKGSIELTHDAAQLYEMQAESPRNFIDESLAGKQENAMPEFFACIREGRRPFADITVGAVAALTVIMGREAIYRQRSVTWKELGVAV